MNDAMQKEDRHAAAGYSPVAGNVAAPASLIPRNERRKTVPPAK
jgi:hypothetical protein